MVSCLLVFPGVRSSLNSGVEPPASGFQSSSYSSLKTSPSIQHRRENRQVSGETTLHNQEYPERFTELYREEKSKERDRGDPEKQSQRERAIKPVIKSPSESGY